MLSPPRVSAGKKRRATFAAPNTRVPSQASDLGSGPWLGLPYAPTPRSSPSLTRWR